MSHSPTNNPQECNALEDIGDADLIVKNTPKGPTVYFVCTGCGQHVPASGLIPEELEKTIIDQHNKQKAR